MNQSFALLVLSCSSTLCIYVAQHKHAGVCVVALKSALKILNCLQRSFSLAPYGCMLSGLQFPPSVLENGSESFLNRWGLGVSLL